MKSQIYLLLALAAVVQSTSSILPSIQNSEETISIGDAILANTSQSRQCGHEILNADTGSIQYKLSEELGLNERCTWLIRADNATGYAVGIFVLGIPEPSADHRLSITSFAASDPPVTTIPDHLGMYDFHDANVLIVTFQTGSEFNASDYTGFMLEYTALFDGTPSVTQASEAFRDASVETNVLIAPGIANPGLTLRFSVWNWGDTVYNERRMMKLVFVQKDGWTGAERIEVYTFDPQNNWQLNTTFDATTDVEVVQSRESVILAYRTSGPTGSDSIGRYRVVNNVCNDS